MNRSTENFSLPAGWKSDVYGGRVDTGISDLQNLLTIAESGWDSDTEAAESPFGMGFFAAIFSAIKVKVESKGKMIFFETAAAIAMQEIDVLSTDYIGAARISLSGFKLDPIAAGAAVKRFAKGFGIRVFFNGAEIDRPHAIGHIKTVTSDVGEICVSGIDCEGLPSANRAYLYFQGLPIELNTRANYANCNNIVHLDKTFQTRMPDRDCLIDPTKQILRVERAIHNRWEKHLTDLKKTEKAERFISMLPAMREFKLMHMLNDVPLLPADCFRRLDYMPNQTDNGTHFQNPAAVSQQQIESGELVVCTNVSNYLHADECDRKSFAALLLIYRKDWLMLNCDSHLHADHWVHKHKLIINGEDVQVNYTPIKEVHYLLDICEGQAILVDSFTITVGDHSVEIGDLSLALALGEHEENTIVIPKSSNGIEALSQVSNWIGEFDLYHEEWKDEDERLMGNFIAEVRGESAAETICKALIKEGIGYKTNCNGATVVASIAGAHGIQCDKLVDVLSKYGEILVDLIQKNGKETHESAIRDSAELFAKKLVTVAVAP